METQNTSVNSSVESVVQQPTKITMGELKNRFPIALKGKPSQSFTFKDWDFALEKQIAKIKDKNPSTGKFISSLMNLCLDTYAGENFQSMENAKKILTVNQAFAGNMFYMYIYLRYDQMGEQVKSTYVCPFCSHRDDKFEIDLNDVDVDLKWGDYEETVIYKLRKSINLSAGDQTVEGLKIGLSKWDMMERSDEAETMNEAAGKELTFKHSIVGVEGSDIPVNIDDVIKKLKKVDIEGLHEFITQHNAGPDVTMELTCKKCRQVFYHKVDWRYDRFFGTGSLSPR